MVETTGLRELKKQRTHDAIVRVALEMFDRHGYAATTIADIAAAAEFAPSTVFAYFPTKEDIVFAGFEPLQASFRERMESRPAGESAIAALRAWAMATIPPLLAEPTDEMLALRRIIDSDERLQVQERARRAMMEDVLTREVARDLAVEPDSAVVRIVAGAVAGAIGAIQTDRPDATLAECERELELVFAFIEAGMAAVERGDP